MIIKSTTAHVGSDRALRCPATTKNAPEHRGIIKHLIIKGAWQQPMIIAFF